MPTYRLDGSPCLCANSNYYCSKNGAMIFHNVQRYEDCDSIKPCSEADHKAPGRAPDQCAESRPFFLCLKLGEIQMVTSPRLLSRDSKMGETNNLQLVSLRASAGNLTKITKTWSWSLERARDGCCRLLGVLRRSRPWPTYTKMSLSTCSSY